MKTSPIPIMKSVVGIFLMLIVTAFLSSCNSSPINVSDLRCEYCVAPLGIDNVNPRLSWKLTVASDVRGQKQTAFQVLVASSKEALAKDNGDLWNSKKQASDQSVNVVYNGATLTSGQECYWKVRVWDTNGHVSEWSEETLFTMGLLQPDDWKGDWIYKEDQTKKDHNWYRKNFTLDATPKSGYLYVASFGYHEIYVNGEKVTEGVMNPVNSYMKKRLPYLTYDIQSYLKEGDNVIGIWHAAGWARWGRMVEYHDAPFVFKAQAEISVRSETITMATDASWKCKKSCSAYCGPWDILNFGGEIVDDRLREDDWNRADYDDSAWANAVVFDQANAKELGKSDVYLGLKGARPVASTDNNAPTSKVTATLSAQMVEPQVKYKEIKAIGVEEKKNGTYVIDMGENYTGFFEMNMLNGAEGDTVVFEVSDQTGQTSSWQQRSMYIYDGTGTGHFSNRFNVAGGRWVTVSGINYKPELKDIKGYVITSNRKQISHFKSSSELLNKIYEVNLNTYLANTIDGILVDCPHRERRGWGEVTVAAMYGDALPNFESGAYMEQYAQFMQDVQADDGKMRAVINGDDFQFLMWMANSPITIWETYRMLSDKHLLQNHYPTLKKWMNWLYKHSNYDKGGALKIGKQGSMAFPGLGDWCTPRGNFWSASNSPESAHFNNCVYAYMLECAKNIAATLDETEDVKLYGDRLDVQRKATHEQMYDANTGEYGNGYQVNQAVALVSGVTPEAEQEKVEAQLVDEVLYNFPYYDTGSSGQGLYTRYFIECGERMDLVYELLQDTRHPSYGYFIREGKTVWPERWSAVGGSQIHTCYTGIGGYFIKGFGGIRVDDNNLGMQNFIIKPSPVGDLTFANTAYESMYGNIVVNWKRSDNSASYHIEVPVNCSAKIYIPAVGKDNVKEGTSLAENAKGISFIANEKSKAVGNYVIYQVLSGSYDFSVDQLPTVSYPAPMYKGNNLSKIGRMSASSMHIVSDKNPGFEAFKANDDDKETKWQAGGKNHQWLEVAWVKPQTFSKIVIDEVGKNIRHYVLQYWDGNDWKEIGVATACGSDKEILFKAVTATKCRLYIKKATNNAVVSEFQVYK